MNFFKQTVTNLFKTRTKIRDSFKKFFNISSLSDKDYSTIEECLLSTDVSWRITDRIIEAIKSDSFDKSNWEESLMTILRDITVKGVPVNLQKVIIMVGVNGVGKTTTCAKLAKLLKDKNKRVLLVAADTYRAAAVKQLQLWSEQIKVPCISNDRTSDSASIAYDGVQSAISKEYDYVIVDTAGRLQNSTNLMNELQKIYRVISKLTNEISVVINLDANIGQNSLVQVEEFKKYMPIDSIILNKMDGTAKGGIALSIIDKFKVPIIFFGIGEKVDNIVPFDMESYISSLVIKEDD